MAGSDFAVVPERGKEQVPYDWLSIEFPPEYPLCLDARTAPDPAEQERPAEATPASRTDLKCRTCQGERRTRKRKQESFAECGPCRTSDVCCTNPA